MGSLYQDIRHERTGGMNRGVQPHQIPNDQWFTVFNMRPTLGRFEQVPLKKVLHYPTPYSNRNMLHLSNLPDSAGNSVIVGLTDKHAVVVRDDASYRLRGTNGLVREFVMDAAYHRWGTEMWDNKLYFVNEMNGVQYTDGAKVYTIPNAPKGRYVQVFFDHLVVGAPIINGVQRHDAIMWSHLNQFDQFLPNTHTEADSFTFTEFQNGQNVMPGVTGMLKLHNLCLIYTACGVYQMQYAGLPKVVRVDPMFPDIGCGLRHSLIGVGNIHFFADVLHKTFFAVMPDSFEDIGGPISTYFMDTVNEKMELAQRTWAYFDPRFSEITWTYVSRESTGAFDRAVVFNVRTKQWYARSSENTHCFCHYLDGGSTTCDELEGTSDTLIGTCDGLAGEGSGFMQIWGGNNEKILGEETEVDTHGDLLAQPWPYLETGDFVYDSFGTLKEVDKLLPQTAFGVPTERMEIYVSVRRFKNDPVVFVKVNDFDPALAGHGIANFNPKLAGRIIRYRFKPYTAYGVLQRFVMLLDQASFTLRIDWDGPLVGSGPILTEDGVPILDEDGNPILPEDPIEPGIPPGEDPILDEDGNILLDEDGNPIVREPPPPTVLPFTSDPIFNGMNAFTLLYGVDVADPFVPPSISSELYEFWLEKLDQAWAAATPAHTLKLGPAWHLVLGPGGTANYGDIQGYYDTGDPGSSFSPANIWELVYVYS